MTTTLPRPDASDLRCAIYARKSNDDLNVDQDRSVERQVASARSYAAQKGWRVLEEHIDVDDGVSGEDFQTRAGFLRLRRSLTPRAPFDRLVAADGDRLGRGQIDFPPFIRDVCEAGVRTFYYLKDVEERVDTPEDRFMMNLRSFVAESEREKGKLRTRDALVARHRNGHVTGGVVYGYRNVPVFDGTDSSGNPKRAHVRHEIEPAQAEVVRGFFRMFADGYGKRIIARTLNGDPSLHAESVRYFGGQRVPPPRKGSGSWAPSGVDAMLKNDRYRGVMIYGKSKNTDRGGRTRCRTPQPRESWVTVPTPELQIVDEDLWTAAQARRREHRQHTAAPVGAHVSEALLAGLATCTSCGGPIVIAGSHKRHRCYGCGPYRDRGPTVCSNSMLEAISRVDARLLEEIERTVLTPEARGYTLRQAAELVRERSRREPAVSLTALKAKLAEVRREIENLVRAVERGLEAPESLVRRIAEKEAEARSLVAAINAAGRPATTRQTDLALADRLLVEHLDRFGEVMRGDVVRARQALQQLLVERIRFTPINIPSVQRTYRLEATLSLGGMLDLDDSRRGHVPDGI
jgi:site-specific DNA recombinase